MSLHAKLAGRGEQPAFAAMMASDSGALLQAKLVLLGDMGAGKSSLVLRFVKGQFFDYQVCSVCPPLTHRACTCALGSQRRGSARPPPKIIDIDRTFVP